MLFMKSAKLTPDEEMTLGTYQLHAGHWAGKNYHETLWAEDLQDLKGYLPGGKIIEIGAGSGTDAEKLIGAGYDYTGTDVSDAMVKTAQDRHPGIRFLSQSVYDLQFPDDSFDGFWAAAIILHIPKKRLQEALAEVRRVLKPGGVGFISVKKGEGEQLLVEPADGGRVYKRLFSFFMPEELKNQLHTAGFETLQLKERKVNENLTWLRFIVRVL
jgi:SAM-dependent methyltransferase